MSYLDTVFYLVIGAYLVVVSCLVLVSCLAILSCHPVLPSFVTVPSGLKVVIGVMFFLCLEKYSNGIRLLVMSFVLMFSLVIQPASCLALLEYHPIIRVLRVP